MWKRKDAMDRGWMKRVCLRETQEEETGPQANPALPEGRKRDQTQKPYPNSTT